MNTRCSNTPNCWSCSAPIRIEFARGADLAKFPHLPGLCYTDNLLDLKSGCVRQGYETPYLTVELRPSVLFRIPHAEMLRVSDLNNATIWERHS
ncbi:MAG: hypothetical protein AAB699_02675 [Patescibacteria group bacterium]